MLFFEHATPSVAKKAIYTAYKSNYTCASMILCNIIMPFTVEIGIDL
jgi:hypothetical protein